MPFADHLRLSASGTLGPEASPTEIWTWRINLSDPIYPGDQGARFDDYVSAVSAYHVSAGSRQWTSSRLRSVKLAKVGPDGLYKEAPRVAAVNLPGIRGALNPPHAFQVAVAISLLSDRYGPTGKGRYYLPCPVVGLDQSGLMSSTEAAEMQAAAASFLNDVNDVAGAIPPEPRVTVASTKGYNSDVTSVRVGRVPDTIRSRRNALVENYSPGAAVT